MLFTLLLIPALAQSVESSEEAQAVEETALAPLPPESPPEPPPEPPLAIPAASEPPPPVDNRPLAIPGPKAPPPPPEAPSERERGMRLYLGGGDAQSVGGGGGGVAAIGFQSMQRGRPLGGSFGAEFAALQLNGSSFPIPVFNFDAALRLTPWPQAKVVPFATAGLGLTMLLIIPFPDATLSAGLELPLGDLRLDLELHGRVIMPLYPGTQQVNVATMRVGLGF